MKQGCVAVKCKKDQTKTLLYEGVSGAYVMLSFLENLRSWCFIRGCEK